MEGHTSPPKEKLPDWLRRWYALKGELRFREAADELERLQRLVEHDDQIIRERNTRIALLESLVNPAGPYEVQTIPDSRSATHYRITDKRTDSRVATCHVPEHAQLVCDALNRSPLASGLQEIPARMRALAKSCRMPPAESELLSIAQTLETWADQIERASGPGPEEIGA